VKRSRRCAGFYLGFENFIAARAFDWFWLNETEPDLVPDGRIDQGHSLAAIRQATANTSGLTTHVSAGPIAAVRNPRLLATFTRDNLVRR
jgi:hypothetical protein